MTDAQRATARPTTTLPLCGPAGWVALWRKLAMTGARNTRSFA